MVAGNRFMGINNGGVIPTRTTMPINEIQKPGTSAEIQRSGNTQASGTSFDSVLKQSMGKSEELKFSKHAELRMMSRNINLTQTQKDKMNKAVNMAEQKGVRDSLVLVDDMAFVVNVKNRTVITAAGKDDLKDSVFTNIDGAVIA